MGDTYRRAGVTLLAAVAALLVAAPGTARTGVATDVSAVKRAAHGAYVAAINSNDVDRLMAVLTDDIVYQPPGGPEVVGRAAVREWPNGYVAAYRTHWQKTSIGFTVSGDWAFERYTYKSSDTDRKTGVVTTDIGKGINVFRRGGDGRWRVAIDGWSSDTPPAP